MGWRFSPEDFRMASIYGTPQASSLADWPITYDDLEPFYCEAEWQIGVCGAAGHAWAGPRSRDYPMPPMDPNSEAEVLGAGAASLGWTTAPVPLLINSVPRDGRPACVHRGACVGFACPAEAKNGTHNTALPRALATRRCTLVTGAVARRVVSDGFKGRAIGVELVKGGSVRSIAAGRVVVCAGAIETARLLLLSGMGNDHVGRHLQGHIYAVAFGLFADEVIDVRGPGPSIATCEFQHGNDGIVGGGMLSNEFTKLPVIFWAASRRPGAPRWGRAMVDDVARTFRRTIHLLGPCQEVPNPDARVRLHRSVTDGSGLPVAHLSGQAHREDLRTAEMLRGRAEQWLRASGADEVWSHRNSLHLSGGQHQAGTCRMSAEPSAGATDPWGNVWGHPGLGGFSRSAQEAR